MPKAKPKSPAIRAEIAIHADQIVMRDPRDLIDYPGNSRVHPESQIDLLVEIFREKGFTTPILIEPDDTIIAGHGRKRAAIKAGMALVPTIPIAGLSKAQLRAMRISDNQSALLSSWDFSALKIEFSDLAAEGFDLKATGFDLSEINSIMDGDGATDEKDRKGSLSDRFGAVPFSVLSAREGWWQDRKRAWLALGIKSEVGRGENLLKMSETMLEPDAKKRAANGRKADARAFGQDLMRGEGGFKQSANLKTGLVPNVSTDAYRDAGKDANATQASGTSIFDPVLCELAYRWFCPPGGTILDPFSGGSVRGIVAGKLGRRYVGVDLRTEQIDANRAQGAAILGKQKGLVDWRVGDSQGIDTIAAGVEADFVFSCPPYADLEVYSDDPADLSTMDYNKFLAAYAAIIQRSCAMLKNDRFACFVVGDVRDKRGAYRGFVPHTIEAFVQDAGLQFYNEAILVTAAGSLALRAGKSFETTRKLGKTHQNVLVFLKGDAKRATEAIGPVEFLDPALLDGADLG